MRDTDNKQRKDLHRPPAKLRTLPLLSPKSVFSVNSPRKLYAIQTRPRAEQPLGNFHDQSTHPLKSSHTRMKSTQVMAPTLVCNMSNGAESASRKSHIRHSSLPTPPSITTRFWLEAVQFQSRTGEQMNVPKPENQDACIIQPGFQDDPSSYVLAVCDGHGQYGHKVSRYIAHHFPERIRSPLGCGAVFASIPEVLRQMQKDVCRSGKFDASFSGSTLVALVVHENAILVTNVGDSRAIVVTKQEYEGVTTIPLTTDHKPSVPEERDRIIKQCGRIEPYYDRSGFPCGPTRVWLMDKDLPGLAMSRSIGDSIAHQVGVTEAPDVHIRPIQSGDIAVVLASDGIWDVMSNEEVGAIVGEYHQKGKEEECCQALVTTAVTRWKAQSNTVDDITVIVGFVKTY